MSTTNESRRPLTAANAMYHLTKSVFIGEKKFTMVAISHLGPNGYDPKCTVVGLMDDGGTVTSYDMAHNQLEIPAKKFEIPKKKK